MSIGTKSEWDLSNSTPAEPGKSSLNAELAAAGPGLVANQDVLRGILAGSSDCIKILDLDGRLQFMSEGGKKVMEVDDFEVLKGCPWPDFWQGQGNDEAKTAIALARQGKTGHFKGAANTAHGTPRFWDVHVSPILDGDDRPAYLLSISRDITEEWRAAEEAKKAAERQSLLTAELQHRIKNTLAMVGAIANQTIRGDSVPAAREAFAARLMALSHAHDILTASSWKSAPIREVVCGALQPHADPDTQANPSGPRLQLSARHALAIALATNELATNSVKYGALSNGGFVTITWANDPGDDKTGFQFRWQEHGGPLVVEPAAEKKGFGSKLIERMLTSDFSGTGRIEYAPSGVVFNLTAPALEPSDTNGEK